MLACAGVLGLMPDLRAGSDKFEDVSVTPYDHSAAEGGA